MSFTMAFPLMVLEKENDFSPLQSIFGPPKTQSEQILDLHLHRSESAYQNDTAAQ